MSEHEWPTLGYSVKGNRYEIKATRGEIYEAYTDEQIIELVDRRALAAKDALIAELEQGNRFTLMPGESLQKKTDINGRVISLCIMAANGEPVSDGVAKLVVLDRQQQAEPLIDTSAWQSCNPGCDPEFNGEKGRHCVCDPAKAAMSAKKANSINPEMVDVVGYTTAGMLRISKDLPLTGRIGAKCKPDERWNVPLMTVAQHERIVVAKDAELKELRDSMAFRTSLIGRLESELEQLRAQSARQVGGDELQAKVTEFIERARRIAKLNREAANELEEHDADEAAACDHMADINTEAADLLEELARAALAPAAVAPEQWEKKLARLHPNIEPGKWPASWRKDAIEQELREFRLNRNPIPVGLLEQSERHLTNWLDLHECECEGGFHYCGREQVAKTRRELRALLGKGNE